jgi:hypothetical protein
VTEPPHAESRPARSRPPAPTADLALLVKVPGRPEAVRACTLAEQSEADDYAAAHGGIIDPLPQSPRTKRLMDQPVAFSTNLVTASAANTMARWASMDSRL